MKIFKLIYLAAFIVITGFMISDSMAQPGGGPPMSEQKKEEIEAMKVAFLTKKLELTPEEAQKFWPVYNQFQGELDKLREAQRKIRKEAKSEMDSLSDKEVEKLVDGEIAFRQSELDVMKKYNSRFKSVLPMKKVAKLYRAEEDFKRELLHKLQERRGEGGGQQRDHKRKE